MIEEKVDIVSAWKNMWYCGFWSSLRNSIKWRRLKVDPQKSEPALLFRPWVSLSLPPARTTVTLAQSNAVRIAFFVAAIPKFGNIPYKAKMEL